MQLLSVNIGKRAQLETPNGLVETGIIKTPKAGKVFVDSLGLEGDAIVDQSVHGGLDQAVYLYSQDDYDWWSAELGKKILPGIFGENLTLSSFGEQPLLIGDRLLINDVLLEISAPRTPCFKLATRMDDTGFIKQFVQAARPGAYARVIKSGSLQTGDRVVLTKATPNYPSVIEVFLECHSKVHNIHILERALQAPLGKYHREIVKKLYEKEIYQIKTT